MTATALWAAVVVSYDVQTLTELTNINGRDPTAINTTFGEDAAQQVIDLWPAYVQNTYDPADALHVAVGKRATIAVLWERGGTAANIAKLKWEDVFNDSMLDKIKRTGPRGRRGPSSNSGVDQSSELLADGTKPRPWSDTRSIPRGILPSQRSSADDRV